MIAPGYYPDGQGQMRWWDGHQWTHIVQPPSVEVIDPAPPQPDMPARIAKGGLQVL
jgi:Protein of unknown function (DUF2510)